MFSYGIMFLLAGIIFSIITFAQWIQNKSYEKNAGSCMAQITDKRQTTVKQGNSFRKVYKFIVSYQIEGINYTTTINALPSEFKNGVGKQIELKYRLQKPQKAVRADQLSVRNIKILIITSAILLIIGSVMWMIG